MKWDWQPIKNEYVTGDMSLMDISKEHGISYNTTLKQARNHHWAADRNQYRQGIEQALQAASASQTLIKHTVEGKEAEYAASFLARITAATERLIQDYEEHPPRDLEARAKVLASIVKLGQSAYGLPTVTEQIAKDRLAHDISKDEHAGEPARVEVVFADERLGK